MQQLTSARRDVGLRRRPLTTPLIVVCAIVVCVAIPAYNKGAVLLGEVVLLGFFFALVPTIANSRFLKITWAVSLLWFGAQLISDWVHGTQMFSGATFAGPTTALLATGLYWIHTTFRLSMPAIMAAAGVGWIALTLIAGETMASANPWKYGLSTPIVVTVLSLAYLWKFKRGSIVVLFLVLAGMSLQFDSRFETGLLLVCAVGLLVTNNEGRGTRRGGWRILFLLALGMALYLAYPGLALSGLIGERAYLQQVLYETQGSNFLLATRLEFPQMINLVAQNPALGIGSHGRLSATDAYAALEWLNDYIAPLNSNTQDYMLNPSEGYPGYNAHSSAMGSALFAGVLALPFWVFLLLATVRSLYSFSQGVAPLPALLIYMGGLTIWDSLFSPLTTRSHIGLAVMLFLACATLARDRTVASPYAKPLSPTDETPEASGVPTASATGRVTDDPNINLDR